MLLKTNQGIQTIRWRRFLSLSAVILFGIALITAMAVRVFAAPTTAPTSLAATAGFLSVDLSWTAPEEGEDPPVTDYVVEYSLAGAEVWTPFDDGESTLTSATVTELTAGTAYDFRVIAVNDDGSSDPSNVVSETPLDPTPGVPTGLAATAGAAQVGLSWTAPVWTGSSAIIDYIVQYSISGQDDWTTFSDGTSNVTSASVTGLVNGTTYDFRVSAANDTHTGAVSAVATSTPFTTPGAPTAVTAVHGNGTATISFTPPASNGGSAITGYTVTSNPGGFTGTGTESPIVVNGLENGTPYTFTVTATNAAGAGTASSASNSVTPATIPGAPTAVTGTPGNGQVSVAFSAPASNGGSTIAGYTVTANPGGATATGATSPIIVPGLSNGTAYTFTVTATNAEGDGPASAASSAVTPRTVPGAPTGVTAVRGNGEATVSFSAPASNGGADITSYTVTSTPGDFTGTGSSSPIVVTGLSNGTSYTFTVTATNVAGTGAASAASNGVTPATTPGAPTGLSATGDVGQVNLSWTAPAANGAAITDYIVEHSLAGANTWTTFNDGTSTATSVIVTGLANGTAYDFRVSAVNEIGASGTATASASTHSVPGAPTAVTGTPGNGQVSVAFSAPASNGGTAITGYTVTSSPGGFTGTGTSSPIAVTGLQNGTSYTFTVTATNAVGTGSSSAASGDVTPRTIPDAPTGVTAVRGNGEATVSFTPPAFNGGSAITEYTVTATPGGATETGGSSPITVTGLDNGTAYVFTVTATNVAGDSAASTASNSVTPATTPGVPTGVTATPENTQVTVSWGAPANNGATITDYVVQYKLTADSTWETVDDGVGTSTSAVVAGLTNGSSYDFRVAAVNEVGTSAYSAGTSATPVAVPGAPTGISATPANARVVLAWTAPADDGGSAITDYVVQYKLSSDGLWTDFSDGESTDTTATVTGLVNMSAYDFRVRAVTSAGVGPASATVSSTPTLTYAALSDIESTATDASVTITWETDVQSNGQVEYGPSASYGNTSAIVNAGGATAHSVTLTDLTPCVTYHFRVTSTPIVDGGLTASTDQAFTTSGCVGDATVVKEQSGAVAQATGGSVTLVDGDREIEVQLPAGYAADDTVVQIKKLNGVPTETTSTPSAALVSIAGQSYEVKAILTDGTLVTEFDEPITITIHYTDADIAGLDEASLSLYNWHGGAWHLLTGCTVDQVANTISCTTSQFSLFALFGVTKAPETGDGDTDDDDDTTTDTPGTGTPGAPAPGTPSTPGASSPDTPVSSDDNTGADDTTAGNNDTGNLSGEEKQGVDEASDSSNGSVVWWIIAGAAALALIIIWAIAAKRRNQ